MVFDLWKGDQKREAVEKDRTGSSQVGERGGLESL